MTKDSLGFVNLTSAAVVKYHESNHSKYLKMQETIWPIRKNHF